MAPVWAPGESAAGEAGAATVTLHWIAAGDDGNVGTAAEYDIRYHENRSVLESWTFAHEAHGEPVPRVAGSMESYVLTGLDFGKTYWIGLKTRDEAFNWSPLSNALQIDPRASGDAPIALE
jgi:hypothetical protein